MPSSRGRDAISETGGELFFSFFKGVELFGWVAKIGPAAFVKAAS